MSSRTILPAVAVTVLLNVTSVTAQGVGFQGGGTASSDQFYVGSHFQIPLGSDRFLLRPSVEGGTGNGVTLASINFEFLYRYEFSGSAWSIYQGSGAAVNFTKFDDATTARGGFNVIFGVSHKSGFFSEIRIGGSGSPNLRYGVGFTIYTGGAGNP